MPIAQASTNQRATAHIGHHHRFAISVTVFKVAIALSAIAALNRRPLLFWCGLGGGLIGVNLLVLDCAPLVHDYRRNRNLTIVGWRQPLYYIEP